MARADAKLKLGPQELKVNTFYWVKKQWSGYSDPAGVESGARIALR